MKSLLLASAATVLLSASWAYADNPLVPNDNDHLAALGFAIDHNAVLRGSSGMQVFASTYRGGATLRPSPLYLDYKANGNNQ